MTAQPAQKLSPQNKRAIILGGGPAGLALADGMSDAGTEFTLFERAKTLGGLAQSIPWKDYGVHDLGPHKIFTLEQELLARVRNLLPAESWLTRDKKSRIFMGGHYLPYPPSPFSLIRVFGLWKFTWMVADYGFAMLSSFFSRSEPKTFAEDLEVRVGRKLYEALFKPIAEKLWGDPRGLDSKLSKGRVQTPKLSEVIGRALGVKKSSEFEALDFMYPQGGLQKLWDSIKAKGEKVGSFQVGKEVRKIVVRGSRVVEIRTFDRETQQEESFPVAPQDTVFSTLPLQQIASFLDPAPKAETVELLKNHVILNDLILVFLYVDKTNFLEDSWIFIPDPSVAFHRLSEQESFDPGMTPNGSIVCCEVMSNELRNMQAKNDEELTKLCIEGLGKLGITGFKVQDSRVIRLPQSYPVFRPGFEAALGKILAELDTIENFRTVGRQGAFNYIGTLDAMDIGYGASRWLLGEADKDSWKSERERTRHYPVLD